MSYHAERQHQMADTEVTTSYSRSSEQTAIVEERWSQTEVDMYDYCKNAISLRVTN
jgi:hypothetical protein